jgi:hypothetical protein
MGQLSECLNLRIRSEAKYFSTFQKRKNGLIETSLTAILWNRGKPHHSFLVSGVFAKRGVWHQATIRFLNNAINKLSSSQ